MSIEHEDRTDFNQNEALNLRLQQLGSDPSTAVEGQIWYRSDLHKARVDDGTNPRSLRYEDDNSFDASTASGNGPLTILTDGVGTDTALVVKASTSATSHLQVDVATTTPIMSFTQTGSQVTIEPTTIHAHSGYDVVSITPPLVQVYNSSPTTPSVVEITAYDVTLNGVSAFDAGSSNPERSTGLLTWTGVKLVKVDATHVGVGALTGVIVDTAGTITDITYAGTASVLDAFVGTTFNTYFTIDSSATLIQRSTHPTPQQAREEIYLGYSVHAPVGTITTVTATPDISFNTMSQVRDVINDGMGIVNKGTRPQANGANLQLNVLGGYLYSMGINFVNNALDPARRQFTALTPATFQYRTQTGAATGNLTSMEVGYYDVAGTRTAIGSSKYSTQRVYVSPAGLVRLQYGQVAYNSMASALAALPSEAFVTYPAFQQNLVLVGSITVSSNATALNDLAQAVFTPASIFGELVVGGGGTSTTTLQGAYSNSTEPEITLDSTRGAVSIKAITDANNSLEILNSAGTERASLKGNGTITASGVINVARNDTSVTTGAGGRMFFGRPADGSLSASVGIVTNDNTLALVNGSGNGTVEICVNPTTPGNIVFGSGTQTDGITDTYVRISNSPVASGSVGNANAAHMGGWVSTYFGIWGGDIAPTNNNYGMLIKGDGTAGEVNGTTYSYLSVNAAGKVRASSTDVLIQPTSTVGEQLSFRKYTGSSAAAIYNGANMASASNTNYSFYASSTGTIVNAPSSSTSLAVGHVYKLTCDADSVAITPTAVAVEQFVFQKYTGGSYAAIYNGGVTPGTTNYALLSNAGDTLLNAPSGGTVDLRVANGPKLSVTGTAITVADGVTLSTPALTYDYTDMSVTTYTALTANTTLNMTAGVVYRRYMANYRLTLGITAMTVQGSTAFLSVTLTTAASYTSYIDYPGSNGATVTISLLNTAINDPIDYMFVRAGSGFMCIGSRQG